MSEHISDQDLLLAYDGELPDSRVDAVRVHTHYCASCEAKWMSLARLSQRVADVQCPEVAFSPAEDAVAGLLARLDNSPVKKKSYWTAHSLAIGNTLAAVAVAITCIVLLPSLRVAKPPAAHPAAVYDSDPAVPPGYVSLPFADPALPLDDAEVLPVELSAEDLELMGLSSGDAGGAAQGPVQAEILIGMDGWPRAIRIVE